MPEEIPERPHNQHTGITHSLSIDNKYFKATLPIWIDEFLDQEEIGSKSSSEVWTDDFCSEDEDVQMVRDSIIAVIYTFDPAMPADNLTKAKTAATDLKGHISQQVSDVLRLVDRLEQDTWDGISIVVAKALSKENSPKEHTPERTEVVEHVKDLFADYGIEVVDMLDTGRKDGERQGVERVREILETHVALSGTADDDDDEAEENAGIVPEDPVALSIQAILNEEFGPDQKLQSFDTTEIDKTLKESGFAFPLLNDQKQPSSIEGADIDVGDMEQLVGKIRQARSMYYKHTQASAISIKLFTN